MSENASNPLKDLWRGAQWIGWAQASAQPSIPCASPGIAPATGSTPTIRHSPVQFPSDPPFTAITHTKDTPDTTVESLGDVIATKRLPNGIELQCTNGLCTIEAVTSRIMRVRASCARIPCPLTFPMPRSSIRRTFPSISRKRITKWCSPRQMCIVMCSRSPFGLRMTDVDGQDLMGGIDTVGWEQVGAGYSKQSPPGPSITVWASERCVSLPAAIIFN